MNKKTTKILYWIFTILLAGFMIFSGISELLQLESAKLALTSLGYPVYLNYIIGLAKLIAAIIILIPQFKILKEWAYAGLTIDFIGAAASIALHGDGIIYALTILPFFAVLFASYGLWKKLGRLNTKN